MDTICRRTALDNHVHDAKIERQTGAGQAVRVKLAIPLNFETWTVPLGLAFMLFVLDAQRAVNAAIGTLCHVQM